MAMSDAGLSAKIKAELEARYGTSVIGFENLFQDFCDAMGAAIVQYLKSNADVKPVALSGTNLNNPVGQPSTGADPQGGTVNSVTNAPQDIEGMGSLD